MANIPQDESSQLPVESVARFLSTCGNEDPALLRRSRMPAVIESVQQSDKILLAPLQPSNLRQPHNDSAGEHSANLEDLVSIAVAAARQAEDAAQGAQTASATARRRMFAATVFGVISIVAGIAGIASAHFGSAEIGVEVTSVKDAATAEALGSAQAVSITVAKTPPSGSITVETPAAQPVAEPPAPQVAEKVPHDAPAEATGMTRVAAATPNDTGTTQHRAAPLRARKRAPAFIVWRFDFLAGLTKSPTRPHRTEVPKTL